MRLLSSYKKEMIIAARGFYFYIEIFFAVIVLLLLLIGVKENSVSKAKEFLFYDMASEVKDYILKDDLEEGSLVLDEPTEFKMKTLKFDVLDEISGEVVAYSFEPEVIKLTTYKKYDLKTGELERTLYVAENEKDMIRLAFQEKKLGATIAMNELGEISFKYFLEGYETEKFVNLIKILHNEEPDVLDAAIDRQTVSRLTDIEVLNTRENLVPIMVVFMGSLMGFFIVMAYIFLDKEEGVIKAFIVTPASVKTYLMSKTLVIITTVLLSSSIITIPIMGLQPNYLLFYLLLIISTFAFASLGLLVASYFDTISKAFGILYFIMIALMIPAFSYFVPSFDPVWIRVFPTYPMIQSMKEIIMVETDITYVLCTALFFLVGGVILFLFSSIRFKKTLTV